MGNYEFGHNASNPFSTGNGYANALIGAFTTYTELTNRVDRDRRHWQTEAYAQDSWRVNARLTLDYGVRLTHSGGYYDARKSTAGFLEVGLGSAARRPGCTGRPAPPAWLATKRARRTTNGPSTRRTRACCSRAPSSETWCLAQGSQINGMVADGFPGMRPGEYFNFPAIVAAPRGGFAWDITGDGKQALRASTGLFWAIPSRGRLGGIHRLAAGRVLPRGPVGDVRRHLELCEPRTLVRRESGQRACGWRRTAVTREVATTST